MKKFLFVMLAVSAFVIAAAAVVEAQDKTKGNVENAKAARKARKELEATFVKRSENVKKMDAEAQLAQVSTDYTATLPDG